MILTPYTIFMDIDRTLIGPDHQADPKTLAAIRRYQAAGHQFFIATGRILKSAHQIADSLGLELNFVASNGAVTDFEHQITRHQMGADALAGIYDVLHAYHLPAHFFTLNKVIQIEETIDYGVDGRNRLGGFTGKDYVRIQNKADLLAWQDDIVNGIAIDETAGPRLDAVRAELSQIPSLTLSSSFPNNIELTPCGISKADAITTFCKEQNIPLDHTIAFGDGRNDLEMIQAVGHGVAMANAIPEVAAAASDHTSAYNENGIGSWLTTFFETN